MKELLQVTQKKEKEMKTVKKNINIIFILIVFPWEHDTEDQNLIA